MTVSTYLAAIAVVASVAKCPCTYPWPHEVLCHLELASHVNRARLTPKNIRRDLLANRLLNLLSSTCWPVCLTQSRINILRGLLKMPRKLQNQLKLRQMMTYLKLIPLTLKRSKLLKICSHSQASPESM
ncbi:hypothetical protein BCR37DRAFT_380318, partial [Protomyces lactucae-debilis]